MEKLTDTYFAAMRAQDIEAFLALFAADATIVWPDGRAVTGLAAIRAAYEKLFAMPPNNPAPGPLMTAPGRCATEVHSRFADGTERRTINVFELGDDGLVTRMASYRQG